MSTLNDILCPCFWTQWLNLDLSRLLWWEGYNSQCPLRLGVCQHSQLCSYLGPCNSCVEFLKGPVRTPGPKWFISSCVYRNLSSFSLVWLLNSLTYPMVLGTSFPDAPNIKWNKLTCFRDCSIPGLSFPLTGHRSPGHRFQEEAWQWSWPAPQCALPE